MLLKCLPGIRSSSATSFQALSLLSMYLYWSSSVSYSTWCCLILLIMIKSMLVSLAMAIAAATAEAVVEVVVAAFRANAATAAAATGAGVCSGGDGGGVVDEDVVSAGSAITPLLLRCTLASSLRCSCCSCWWCGRRRRRCALGVLAGDGMDDNWWRRWRAAAVEARRPRRRRAAAAAAVVAARRHGARSVRRQLHANRGRRWGGGGRAGGGGVSVGRPPCWCPPRRVRACRRRADGPSAATLSSYACVRASTVQQQTRRLPLDTAAAGRPARTLLRFVPGVCGARVVALLCYAVRTRRPLVGPTSSPDPPRLGRRAGRLHPTTTAPTHTRSVLSVVLAAWVFPFTDTFAAFQGRLDLRTSETSTRFGSTLAPPLRSYFWVSDAVFVSVALNVDLMTVINCVASLPS